MNAKIARLISFVLFIASGIWLAIVNSSPDAFQTSSSGPGWSKVSSGLFAGTAATPIICVVVTFVIFIVIFLCTRKKS